MIRRPLNERFAEKVLAGVKTTTIRDNPWPVGKPIMLFRWEGKPYRSKQVEIAPVIVEETCGIRIVVGRLQVAYLAERKIYNGKLWKSEGFNSIEDMDSWFVATIKPGTGVTKSLMRFKLYTPHAT